MSNAVFDYVPVAELDTTMRECWVAHEALKTLARSVHVTHEAPATIGISTQYDLLPTGSGEPHVALATYVDRPLMQCLIGSYIPLSTVTAVWMLIVEGVWYIVAYTNCDNYYVLSDSLIIGMFN